MVKIDANEYRDLLFNKDELRLEELLSEVEYEQYYFLLRPKITYYNNSSRLVLSVVKIEDIDRGNENKRVNQLLNSLLFPQKNK